LIEIKIGWVFLLAAHLVGAAHCARFVDSIFSVVKRAGEERL
jgi:hypothetical protein